MNLECQLLGSWIGISGKESKKMAKKIEKELTLSQHAELWYAEQENVVPQRGTSEWDDMYAEWIEFAF